MAPGLFGTDAVNLNQVQNMFRNANRGIAMAMAMGNTLTPSAPGKTTVNVTSATYGGQYGTAVSVAHRLNVDLPVYVSGSFATAGNGNWSGRVGVGMEF